MAQFGQTASRGRRLPDGVDKAFDDSALQRTGHGRKDRSTPSGHGQKTVTTVKAPGLKTRSGHGRRIRTDAAVVVRKAYDPSKPPTMPQNPSQGGRHLKAAGVATTLGSYGAIYGGIHVNGQAANRANAARATMRMEPKEQAGSGKNYARAQKLRRLAEDQKGRPEGTEAARRAAMHEAKAKAAGETMGGPNPKYARAAADFERAKRIHGISGKVVRNAKYGVYGGFGAAIVGGHHQAEKNRQHATAMRTYNRNLKAHNAYQSGVAKRATPTDDMGEWEREMGGRGARARRAPGNAFAATKGVPRRAGRLVRRNGVTLGAQVASQVGMVMLGSHLGAKGQRNRDDALARSHARSVSKAGEWKTIDQRRDAQMRARREKKYGRLGAVAGTGLVVTGMKSPTYTPPGKEIPFTARKMRDADKLGRMIGANRTARVRTAGRIVGQMSPAGKLVAGGGALVGGSLAAVAHGHARDGHQQRKINERRRANQLRRSAVEKGLFSLGRKAKPFASAARSGARDVLPGTHAGAQDVLPGRAMRKMPMRPVNRDMGNSYPGKRGFGKALIPSSMLTSASLSSSPGAKPRQGKAMPTPPAVRAKVDRVSTAPVGKAYGYLPTRAFTSNVGSALHEAQEMSTRIKVAPKLKPNPAARRSLHEPQGTSYRGRVDKAFDPEGRRQRRAGFAGGAGVTGGAVLARSGVHQVRRDSTSSRYVPDTEAQGRWEAHNREHPMKKNPHAKNAMKLETYRPDGVRFTRKGAGKLGGAAALIGGGLAAAGYGGGHRGRSWER